MPFVLYVPFVALFVATLWEAVGYDVFGWRLLENRVSVSFKPGVTVEYTTGIVSHTEYDSRRCPAAREIAMEYSRAFPTYWFEHQEIG